MCAFQVSDCLRFSTCHEDAMMALNSIKEKLVEMREASKVSMLPSNETFSCGVLSLLYWFCCAWCRIWKSFRSCLKRVSSASQNWRSEFGWLILLIQFQLQLQPNLNFLGIDKQNTCHTWYQTYVHVCFLKQLYTGSCILHLEWMVS